MLSLTLCFRQQSLGPHKIQWGNELQGERQPLLLPARACYQVPSVHVAPPLTTLHREWTNHILSHSSAVTRMRVRKAADPNPSKSFPSVPFV